MKVAFEAQIMQNNIKSLRSMDKEARLLLEYKAEIDELFRFTFHWFAVMIVIMDEEK